MAIPSGPYAIQVNWTDSNTWNYWDQSYANLLSDCPRRLDVTRGGFHETLGTEALHLTARDPSRWVRPLKASSPLWPNVRLHRRIRILEPVGATYQGVWFGYLTAINSDPRLPEVTITAESPLAVLARREVILPTRTNPSVMDAGNLDCALLTLLRLVGLYNTGYVLLDDVGNQQITGTWGGGKTTFGAALGQLTKATGCVVAAEPLYAQNPGDPDWRFRWYRPAPGTAPTVHLDWAAGELEGNPTVTYTEEVAR